MSTVDRVFGDWYLKSINGNVIIDTANGQGSTTILGNLFVIGSQTNVGSIETLIADNIITLAANVTGQPVLNAGIEVRRGDLPTVSLRWNESIDRWEMTDDGVSFYRPLKRVSEDPDPHLGGNLIVAGYAIQSENNQNIILAPSANSGIEIDYTVGNTIAKAGATIVSAKAPAAGESALYVTNSLVDNEELITKRKALVYSLVL